MSVAPTIWTYRQCLRFMLRSLILDYAVPAINTDVLQQMTAQGIAVAKIPQFADASVIGGSLLSVGAPMICIVGNDEDDDFLAMRHYNSWLATQIQVKTPFVADNAPEDFSVFFDIIVDTLRDLLNGPRGVTLQPVNPATGNFLLKDGQAFQNCRMTGVRSMPFPNYSPDKTTRCQGLLISHMAMVDYSLDRSNPLGG